ncbi:MAG: NifB/NifX family molybdenum-iron cluster-binding protein [Sulfurovaceae bacterium]|nr:NifB/NifX family molybdenum-iron cluster-binding protein [Sulfurovaceae bacterium]
MKIAFASKDGVHVNEHFGWCEKFYLYKIDSNGVHDLGTSDASLKFEEEIDRLDYKIECLKDSNIACVAQIGPKAATLLQSFGIYPLRSSNENETIESINNTLYYYLKDEHAPLWFKRIIYQQGMAL